MTGRTRTAIIFGCIAAALAFGLIGASASGGLCSTQVPCPGGFAVQGNAVPTTITPTPSATSTVAPPGGDPFSVELSAEPDEVVCDGSQSAHIAAHVRSRFGSDVQDGTPVYFGAFGPANSLSTGIGTTLRGVTGTDVRAFSSPGLPFEPVRVQVDVGRIEASIRVLCLPPASCPTCPPPCDPASPPQPASPPCQPPCSPASPPQSVSPPCVPPTPTPVPCTQQLPPCGPFCPPPESPPGAASPPCFTPTSSPCGPAVSPPCATPTPACDATTSPPCLPFSPPQCGGTASPPCATPTPSVRCADVNGDHLVTARDLILIAQHIGAKKPNVKYDANGDGHVDARDLDFTLRQIGRTC